MTLHNYPACETWRWEYLFLDVKTLFSAENGGKRKNKKEEKEHMGRFPPVTTLLEISIKQGRKFPWKFPRNAKISPGPLVRAHVTLENPLAANFAVECSSRAEN